MDRLRRIILKCNNCQNFYRLTVGRWAELKNQFVTTANIVKNFLCAKCIATTPIVLRTRKKVHEYTSPEEIQILSNTITQKAFTPEIVIKRIKEKQRFLVLNQSPKHGVYVITKDDVNEIAKTLE